MTTNDLSNFRPVASILCLGKPIEVSCMCSWMRLDRFQLVLRPLHGMEAALVALEDKLLREVYRGSVTLLVLLRDVI